MPLSPYDGLQWLRTRQRIWERDHGKCRICGRDGCDVHHLRYDRGFHNDDYLMLVCRPCHNVWQGDPPDHVPDDNPLKATLTELARLARCLPRR